MIDTALLEWKLLREQWENAEKHEEFACWLILEEHQDYMVSKGFEIKENSILSPRGEVVWCRQ